MTERSKEKNMNWMLWLKSGAKYFLVAAAGVLVAALGVALTGFTPDGAMQEVLFKYAVAPLLAAVIGLIKNFIQHNGK